MWNINKILKLSDKDKLCLANTSATWLASYSRKI